MKNMKVNILGTEWNIHIVKEFPEHLKEHEETATGLCNGFDKDIFVKDMSDCDCKDKEQLIKNVMRHEILHAFLFESGLSENAGFSGCWATNEEMVDWFAIQSPKIFAVYQRICSSSSTTNIRYVSLIPDSSFLLQFFHVWIYHKMGNQKEPS